MSKIWSVLVPLNSRTPIHNSITNKRFCPKWDFCFQYITFENDIFRSNWGQEGAGIKENEIQIVTLEKQKDTYQVIPPKMMNYAFLLEIIQLSPMHNNIDFRILYQEFGRTEATFPSNITPRTTECTNTMSRMCRFYSRGSASDSS